MVATVALLVLASVHRASSIRTTTDTTDLEQELLPAEQALPGKVDELYLLGAPGPFFSTPKNLGIDCFPGVRLINVWGRKEFWAPSTIDIVPAATATIGLRHFRMDIGRSDLRYKNYSVTACSEKTNKDPEALGTVALHVAPKYEEGKEFLPYRLGAMTTFARMAYKDDKNEVNRNIAPYDYRLVGTSESQTDWYQISHLTQNTNTLGCILTFHGTEDKVPDWIANFRARPVRFCGLDSRVHRGFRDQLRRKVGNPEFQELIRPKLPYCRTLVVVGHSMGGAVAELLAACLANAPRSDPDYDMMSFTKATPKLIKV